MSSSNAMENVLVATIGTSPAVLTETVWALAHRTPPVIIDRVVVMTTLRGRSELRQTLLAGQPSIWQRLQQVLAEERLAVQHRLQFHDSDIHVIEANGQPLDDIRSTDDNRAVGDQLLSLLLELSASPGRTIYASLNKSTQMRQCLKLRRLWDKSKSLSGNGFCSQASRTSIGSAPRSIGTGDCE